MASEDEGPPWRYEARHRRLAANARRAIKRLGLKSVEELKATPRPKLLRGLTPGAYDVVNDALNSGDEARLRELLEGE